MENNQQIMPTVEKWMELAKITYVSCAENWEDVYLERIFYNQPEGFYIDIGAARPLMHSNTALLYKRGWCGINIEPQKHFYDELQKERPRDINLNIMVSNKNGRETFYVVPYYNEGSTVKKEVIEHFRNNLNIAHEISETQVEARTLADICSEYCKNKEIDLLKIDTEGNERNVLEGADFSKWRPRVLMIEATVPGTPKPNHEEWENIVLDADYKYVWFDGLNRYYVRKGDENLVQYLAKPFCLFDGIVIPLWVINWFISVSEQLLSNFNAKELEKETNSFIEFLKELRNNPLLSKKLRDPTGRYGYHLRLLIAKNQGMNISSVELD